jgi:hypothetical protein
LATLAKLLDSELEPLRSVPAEEVLASIDKDTNEKDGVFARAAQITKESWDAQFGHCFRDLTTKCSPDASSGADQPDTKCSPNSSSEADPSSTCKRKRMKKPQRKQSGFVDVEAGVDDEDDEGDDEEGESFSAFSDSSDQDSDDSEEMRAYHAEAIMGQIAGEVHDEPSGSEEPIPVTRAQFAKIKRFCNECGHTYSGSEENHCKREEHNIAICRQPHFKVKFMDSYEFLNRCCLVGTATIVDYLNYSKTDQVVDWLQGLGFKTIYDKRNIQEYNLKCGYIALAAVVKFLNSDTTDTKSCLDLKHVREVNKVFQDESKECNQHVRQGVLEQINRKGVDSAPALSQRELDAYLEYMGLRSNNWTFDKVFWNVASRIKKFRDEENYTTQQLTFTFSTDYSGSSGVTHYATVHLDFKITGTTVIDTLDSNTLPGTQKLNRNRKYQRIESDTE